LNLFRTTDDEDTRKSPAGDILRVTLLTVFFGAAAYALHLPEVRERIFDVDEWRARAAAFGGADWLAILAAFAAANACGIPRRWISAIAGGLYGPVHGVILAQTATMIGATANFFMARWLLRDVIRRRLPPRLLAWHDRFGENGFRWVFYIRLFPLGSATVVSLVSGTSVIPFSRFAAATFLGYLPYTVAFALFGSSAAERKLWQLLLAAALFAVVAIGCRVFRVRRPDGIAEENR